MPVDVDDLILLFCHLSEQKEMKAVPKRLNLLPGAGGLIGGLLGGLTGLIVGMMVGYRFSDENRHLKPVPQILLELPPDKKKKLCDRAMVILYPFDWSGLSQLIALVEGNVILQQQLIALLRDYFSKELRRVIKPLE